MFWTRDADAVWLTTEEVQIPMHRGKELKIYNTCASSPIGGY